MDSARISALLEPFLVSPLSQLQLQQISTYIDILLRWNARINLTAIRNEEEVVTRHFGESLFLARHVFPDGSPHALKPTRVLDIGSGAGFPALPLKIYSPQIHLTMIESNHKKATFLREVARALTLTDINVIAERAEGLSANPSFPKAEVVTFRAVEKFDQTLKQATTLLAPHGIMALLIGASQLGRLAQVPELSWSIPVPIPSSDARVLSIGKTAISGTN
jgi:16S rRNA (guanine527-N7)-methyltransferase